MTQHTREQLTVWFCRDCEITEETPEDVQEFKCKSCAKPMSDIGFIEGFLAAKAAVTKEGVAPTT